MDQPGTTLIVDLVLRALAADFAKTIQINMFG